MFTGVMPKDNRPDRQRLALVNFPEIYCLERMVWFSIPFI